MLTHSRSCWRCGSFVECTAAHCDYFNPMPEYITTEDGKLLTNRERDAMASLLKYKQEAPYIPQPEPIQRQEWTPGVGFWAVETEVSSRPSWLALFGAFVLGVVATGVIIGVFF